LIAGAHGPFERQPLAGSFLQGLAIGGNPSRAVPLSRSPITLSARPRLFWVPAQSSGMRPRVYMPGLLSEPWC
jgi:hypothetical protein